MISSVAYADEEMLSEAKMASPLRMPTRSSASSSDAMRRPTRRGAGCRGLRAERAGGFEDLLGGDQVPAATLPELASEGPDDLDVSGARLGALHVARGR